MTPLLYRVIYEDFSRTVDCTGVMLDTFLPQAEGDVERAFVLLREELMDGDPTIVDVLQRP